MQVLREKAVPEQRTDSPPPASLPKTTARRLPDRQSGGSCGRVLLRKRADTLRVVGSDELLQGQREMLIRHGSQTYRLFRTRNDKLILQK